MTRLGPGVRMKQIDQAERTIGHTGQDVQGIAHVQSDVRQESIADMLQRADYSVQERLAADKAMIRQQVGTISEMLAGPEADFEVKGAIIAEQSPGRDRPFLRHFDLREQLLKQLRMSRAALVPLTDPKQGVVG